MATKAHQFKDAELGACDLNAFLHPYIHDTSLISATVDSPSEGSASAIYCPRLIHGQPGEASTKERIVI